MALVVKKFGGSSVATPEKIKGVVARVLADKKPEDKVVVVVSAMGDTTDDLIALAKQLNDAPYGREMDMLMSTGEQVSIALLAMAFAAANQPAVSMTGFQAGIKTGSDFGKGRIKSISPERIIAELDKGKIVVVAGFQGITDDGDITTLGRGGSDTTAVSVAGAIKADVCEIYTDVEGIYSTDPRIVSDARKMQEITYSEMLEMARLGALVMQPRSVEMGMHYGVPIHVRSTFSANNGTIIRGEYTMEEKSFVIRGVASDSNIVKVAVIGVPDKPGVAGKIFSVLAKANIDVDMIVQSVRDGETSVNDIVFTIAKPDLSQAKPILDSLIKDLGIENVLIGENVAKVSAVGAGMLGHPGIAADMFSALGEAGINIEIISTSEISISCLVEGDKVKEAVRAIHAKFFPVD